MSKCIQVGRSGCTYPLARPTTSFFSSQCWPCLYSPLSSTALLSPLVKNLMSPFSLWTKYQRDFIQQRTPSPLIQHICAWMRIHDECEISQTPLWAFLDSFSIQWMAFSGQQHNNKMCIHTFHGSLVLCVLLGSLCLLSWRQQSLRLWWDPLPGWSETAGLLCGKLAPYSHWNEWQIHIIKVSSPISTFV